jgi:hypothetical protein
MLQNTVDSVVVVAIIIIIIISSVDIAMGYGRDDRGVGVRFSAGARYSSLLCKAQVSSGAHSTTYITGTGNRFSGGKVAGA